jgi:cytochrome c
VVASASPRYGLGRTPSAAELATADISISPTGIGLPKGHGTARDGETVYLARCAGCHGLHAEGLGDFPALVGGRGTLATKSPLLTVGSYWPFATTLFDYVRRAMPYTSPGTLSSDDIYEVVAFVLFKNEILAADVVVDAQTLPRIVMPNADGFRADPRPDVAAPRENQPRR